MGGSVVVCKIVVIELVEAIDEVLPMIVGENDDDDIVPVDSCVIVVGVVCKEI